MQRSQTRCHIRQVGWFMEPAGLCQCRYVPQTPKPTHVTSRKNNKILVLQQGFPFLVNQFFNPVFFSLSPLHYWTLASSSSGFDNFDFTSMLTNKSPDRVWCALKMLNHAEVFHSDFPNNDLIAQVNLQ